LSRAAPLFLVMFVALDATPLLGAAASVAGQQTSTVSTAITLNTTETLPPGYYYPFSVPNTYPNATFGYYFSVSNTSVILRAEELREALRKTNELAAESLGVILRECEHTTKRSHMYPVQSQGGSQ